MKTLIRLLFITPLLSTLGCTQNSQDLTDSFSLALYGHDSIELTQKQVNEIPYASQVIQFGDNPQALMVLAWAEPNASQSSPSLKWLSADNEMIVTRSGRIVKTANFPNSNLMSIRADKVDPLARGLHLETTPHHWSYTISWQPGYHIQYEAQSRFEMMGEVVKQLPFEQRTLLHVKETVSIPVIDHKSTNHYWLDPESGKVIASEQAPIPNRATFKLTIAKPYQ